MHQGLDMRIKLSFFPPHSHESHTINFVSITMKLVANKQTEDESPLSVMVDGSET